MKLKLKALIILLALSLTFTACGSSESPSVQSGGTTVSGTQETSAESTAPAAEARLSYELGEYDKGYAELIIDSGNLENLISESTQRKVYVHLPPSYSEGNKSYPVVYYLDGYEEDAKSFIITEKGTLDKYFADNDEFILVCLDGETTVGASFYADSEVSGNWESFISADVVKAVDSTLRTKPEAKYRGIMGYSMGGFGALNIAMKHPDVFGSVIAFAPGVFAPENFNDVMDTWRSYSALLISYGRAFAPNTQNENKCDIPAEDGSDADKAIIEKWYTGFSSWDNKADAYNALSTKLLAIEIAYSETDYYSWIPKGCVYLDNILTERNIAHSLTTFSGGHIVPTDAASENYGPFFNAVFTG